MAKKMQTADPIKALLFPFHDQAWLKKMAIACLLVFLGFVPVLSIALLLGYMAEIIKRIVIRGEEPSLPEWDKFSSFFTDGLRLFGIGAVYLLPSTALFVLGYLGVFLPVLLMQANIADEGTALALVTVGYLAAIGLMACAALISIFTGIILPIAGIHATVKGDFKAAFQFKEIWFILKANWSGILLAFLIVIGASFFLYYGTYFLAATIIFCCLYPLATCLMIAYLGLASAGLFGEAYKIGLANLPAGE